MHPYVVALSLPLIGIIVFWLLPLPQAIYVYIFILLVSGSLYWVIAKAIRKVPKNSLEGLAGSQAIVVSKLGLDERAQYMVKVRGELWSANSSDELKADEIVKILAVKGLILQVGKINDQFLSQANRS